MAVWVPSVRPGGDVAEGRIWGVRIWEFESMRAWVPSGARDIGVPDTVIALPGRSVWL